MSRRAVYNTLEWIEEVPPGDPTLLETLLAYQLERQAESESARNQAPGLARQLVKVAFDPNLRPKDADARRLAEGFPDRRRVSRAGSSPMTSVFIEPLDVLVLRGNKLFGDPGSYGESLGPAVAVGRRRRNPLGDTCAGRRPLCVCQRGMEASDSWYAERAGAVHRHRLPSRPAAGATESSRCSSRPPIL